MYISINSGILETEMENIPTLISRTRVQYIETEDGEDNNINKVKQRKLETKRVRCFDSLVIQTVI